MPLPDAATQYFAAQQKVSLSTLMLCRRLWAKLGAGDFDQAWASLGPQLLVMLTAGQKAAAGQALVYVPSVLAELNIDATSAAEVAVRAFAGVASDGRPLSSLLYQSVVRTRVALGEGASLDQALGEGGKQLDRIVANQVIDAGRAAESVASVVRPAVTGFVRMLNLPSCDRCVVLAGRFYRFSEGFSRHPPTCDCRHIPATESVAGDLQSDPLGAIRAGQVTGLSIADTDAILKQGADPFKVINAKRGMSTEQVFGERLKVTTEGTSRRARNRTVTTVINGRRTKVRPRPQAIYDMAAGNEAEQLRLLKLYGYVL